MASSASCRTCSSLPDDIVLEIFTYLPLKSIYKFKCLSKVWISNLSDPSFIIKWFIINNKSIPWIHYHTIFPAVVPTRFRYAVRVLDSQFISINKHFFSFEFLMNQKPFHGAARLLVLGSSNGLVLCLSVSSDYQNSYHVCNPLTQKWVSLPSPPRSPASYLDLHGIFCDYSSSSLPSCYKVVRIPRFNTPSNQFDVDLFSSDVGVWENFQVSCDDNVVWALYSRRNAFMLKDVLFWTEDEQDRLLAYNINQNNERRCNLINLPHGESGILNDGIVGESEGWVCYSETRTAAGEMTVSVWVLDEEDWKILHKDISLSGVLVELCCEVTRIRVLGFSPVDRNVVLFGCKHSVWGFNIKTRKLEELCLYSRHENDSDWMHQPFVLKPMPTVLPPPSWIDNESDLCV